MARKKRKFKINYTIPKAPPSCSLETFELDGRTLSYSGWVEERAWEETRFPITRCYARCFDVETGEEVRLGYGEYTKAMAVSNPAMTMRDFLEMVK